MAPGNIIYIDSNSILIINGQGRLLQLFVPIRVKCWQAHGNLKSGSTLYVDQVQKANTGDIFYKILGTWHPHSYFEII